MPQPELLIGAVTALEAAEVGYVMTGSLVTSLQGEWRSTGEINLIVEAKEAVVESLSDAFGAPPYVFNATAARRALATNGGFELLDNESGDKVDFWTLTDSSFDRSRFARRIETEVFGRPVAVTAPEDTLLPKLLWASNGFGGDLHLEDAIRVYEAQVATIDDRYLDAWASHLGVIHLLAEVREKAFSN